MNWGIFGCLCVWFTNYGQDNLLFMILFLFFVCDNYVLMYLWIQFCAVFFERIVLPLWSRSHRENFHCMGVSCSCPLAFFFDLESGFESLFASSIKLENDEKNPLVRSSSSKGKATEPARLQSIGSGKLLREGSLRFRARKNHIMRFIEAQADDSYTGQESVQSSTLDPSSPKHEAAIKLQKVYKSFRTRRKLADCAVLIEQSWWKVLDFAELKRSSISFFDIEKHETAISRWSRARTRAAKVKFDCCITCFNEFVFH